MKSLTRLALVGVLSAFVLTGCPKFEEFRHWLNYHAGAGSSREEEKTPYQKTVDIAKNPAQIVTGQVAQSKIPRGLEDYFFQEKELDGLTIPSEIFIPAVTEYKNIKSKDSTIKISNRILSPEELSFLKERDKGETAFSRIVNYGVAHYTTLKQDASVTYPDLTDMYVYQFKDEKDNWNYLNQVRKLNPSEQSILFVNKNISCWITFEDFLDVSKDANLSNPIIPAFEEQITNGEKIYVQTLMNYAKRIGGEFYFANRDKNWDDSKEIYEKLDIPVKESTKYLGEALEFQRKLYDMSDEEVAKSFRENFNINLIDRYMKGEINKDNDEAKEAVKKLGRKFLFAFPIINKRFNYPLDEMIQSLDVTGQVAQSKISQGIEEILFEKGGNIYIMDEYGSNLRNLIENSGLNASSSFWSLDGEKIIFQAYDKEKNNDIYIINYDGSNLKNLTNTPDKQEIKPSLSYDGKNILFRIRKGNQTEDYVMSIEGNEKKRLSEEELGNIKIRNKNISPDEKLVVFQQDNNQGRDIFVMETNEHNLRNLTNTPNLYESNPSWSSDGKKIVFECASVKGYTYNPNIGIINIDGTDWKRITKDDFTYHSNPSFRPR